MSEYQKQSWNAYDEDLSLEENIGKGAVATPERMEHMEEGIAQANKPYTAGTVTSGEAGTDPSVTVNEDKSIDFVIPKGEQGEEGESAYEIWKAQPGNESKTEEEFLASLVGPAGVAGEEGQSAYEIWVAQPGNEGKTEEEFLAALKGEKGETGAQGEKGEKGDPFRVAKTYASVEEMNAGYASDGVPVGQFVMITTGDVNDEDNAKLYVKGETEYEFVTDLSGAQGIKGDKGDQGEQGPAGADGAKGDKGDQGEKGDKGDQGDPGPAGAAGAKGDKGDKGDQGDPGPAGADGEDGQSAYELWKAQPGNESKTEEEFLASLKGEKGDKGDKGDQGEKGEKGEPFAVAKTYASVAEMNEGYATDGVLEGQFVMITTGDVNDEDNAKLYVKGSTQYDFVTDLSGAQGIKGDQGEKGDKGDQGDPGPAGAAGAKGDKGDQGEQGPAGAAGAKGDKGDQGEQGPAGADGQSAYELWKAQPGNESKTEEEFLASLKGEKGDKGDQGEQGPAGADGQDGAPGAQGEKGEKGDPGVTFVKGASVETGAWVDQTGVFKAEVTVSGLVAGDMVVMNLGHDTYDVAKTAEVRPYTVCEDGKFAIYATTAPTATITIDYAVFKAPVA